MLLNEQPQTPTQRQIPHTKKTLLNFLQTNLGRCYAAYDAAYATTLEKDIDILIASEPNKKIVCGRSWICDNKKDVAVSLINSNIQVHTIRKGDGTLTISFTNFDLICCYISPNCSENAFTLYVNNVVTQIRSGNRNFILLGDFNAKSPMWGSPTKDRRGEVLAELASQMLAAIGLGAIPINDWNLPTFVRGRSQLHIDVTFLSEPLLTHRAGWTALDNEAMSHHKHIFFQIRETTSPKRTFREKTIINTNKLKELLTANHVKSLICDPKHCSGAVKKLYLQTTTSNTLPRRTLPYWWNDQIDLKRKE